MNHRTSPVHLIVAGAEKAGTTSLHTYLAAHPQVRASAKKETDFFRHPVRDLAPYLKFFGDRDAHVLLESSPAYLAEAAAVAPRIAQWLPQARLVFVLREPIDRLKSSFRFYKSRLHLAQSMSLDRFVECCLAYEDGTLTPQRAGVQAWHLQALRRGRYEEQLPAFAAHIGAHRMLVLDHAALRDDVRRTVAQVARFAGIDPAFYERYGFARENVSFLARRAGIHRIAIGVNDRFESVWRRHPRLKQRLLALYKRLNARPLDPDQPSADTMARLQRYYAGTHALLDTLFPPAPHLPPAAPQEGPRGPLATGSGLP